MIVQESTTFVHANGIDIHYIEAGSGEPLLLLHGGMVSTNPIWGSAPVAYTSHMERLAEHFRVIAPDTRGSGRTRHSGGTITHDLLADDVVALIEALDLERPMIAGFSEGGITATVVGIRTPGAVRAIVNDAGYDVFDQQAPTFAMMRDMFGGRPDATETDPDAVARFFEQSEQMRPLFELMKADEDGGQGAGHWREYLRLSFHRTTQSPGYALEDLGRITVPTLILVGDRDQFCSAEQGVEAYRMLQDGELAVLPGTGHVITADGVSHMIDFLERNLERVEGR